MQLRRHLSIVICGHVDSGKSTTTGRLLFELGGIPERELEKLKVRSRGPQRRSAGSGAGVDASSSHSLGRARRGSLADWGPSARQERHIWRFSHGG